jgi:lysophospholipase L1-like esterase
VPPRVQELWQLFNAILQTLQAEVNRHGAQMGVVIIPREAQVHEELYVQRVSEYTKRYDLLQAGQDVWDMSAPDRAISEAMAELDIPTLDLMPGFQTYAQTHDGLLYFEKDIHFNEKGHQLAANLICDWLVEQELIPLQ